MEELGALIAQAGNLAETERKKQRTALRRAALWGWMRQGRQEYLETQKQESQGRCSGFVEFRGAVPPRRTNLPVRYCFRVEKGMRSRSLSVAFIPASLNART